MGRHRLQRGAGGCARDGRGGDLGRGVVGGCAVAGWESAAAASGGGGGDRNGGEAASRRRAPGDHGGHGPLLGSRRGGARGVGGGVGNPRVSQRTRTRMRRGGPRAVLLAHARPSAAGGGRGAGDRGADGLPTGLRRSVRGADADRGDRRGGAPCAGTRGRSLWSCTGRLHETLGDLRAAASDRSTARTAPRSASWVAELRAAEMELREAERAELEDGRAPLHPMRVYGELRGVLGSRCDRDRRRRRLRVVCGPGDR